MEHPKFAELEARIEALEIKAGIKKAETAVSPVAGEKSGTAKKGAK